MQTETRDCILISLIVFIPDEADNVKSRVCRSEIQLDTKLSTVFLEED